MVTASGEQGDVEDEDDVEGLHRGCVGVPFVCMPYVEASAIPLACLTRLLRPRRGRQIMSKLDCAHWSWVGMKAVVCTSATA